MYFYRNENLKMEFRKATIKDFSAIWEIIKFAIESRKIDGSKQWQDGYPNTETIFSDIENGYGYVLVENKQLLFYSAIIFDIEPAYEAIEGKWLTNGDYCTVHRMAVAPTAVSKGLATEKCITKHYPDQAFTLKTGRLSEVEALISLTFRLRSMIALLIIRCQRNASNLSA